MKELIKKIEAEIAQINDIQKREAARKRVKSLWEKYLGDDRIVTMEEVIETEKLKTEKQKIYSTGIPGLDKLLEEVPGDGGIRDTELITIAGPTKNGKCLAEGTKVRMIDGTTKKVEEIKNGDLLMGPDSKPRKIISLGHGYEKMYKVILRDGTSFTCNASHILSLKKTGESKWRVDNKFKEKRPRKKNKGSIVNISVQDYLLSSNTFKHVHKAYKVGIELPTKPVSVEPYFLGLWLGDGDSDSVRITTQDKVIVDYLYNYASTLNGEISIIKQPNNKSSRYSIVRAKKKTLQTRLRELNVLGNKHIPIKYKHNSRNVRLSVLAGIIDSDGYFNFPSAIGITLKRTRLVNDVIYLSRSLGFYTSMKKKMIDGVWYNRIYISGKLDEIPLKLQRKMPKLKNIKDTSRQNFIINSIGKGKYFGFELDNDGLFLLDNFIVTHNTTLAMTITANLLQAKVVPCWFSYEMTPSGFARKMPDETLPLIYTPKKLQTNSTEWIEERIIEAIAKYDASVFFLDHLNYVCDLDGQSSENTSVRIGRTMRKLKRIATEWNVCLVLMAHTIKIKPTEEPTIASLRDSSFIAAESDTVIYVRRVGEETNYSNETEIFVIANRWSGENGGTKLIYDRKARCLMQKYD